MIILVPRLITDKLQPSNPDKHYIIRHNGSGAWYEDEVSELSGYDINGPIKDYIKVWYEEIEILGEGAWLT